MRVIWLLIVAFATSLAASAAAAQPPSTSIGTKKPAVRASAAASADAVTNADVAQMVRLQLSDSLIEGSLRRAPKVRFDLTPAGLTALKQAKVSDNIIQVMFDVSDVAPKNAPATTPVAAEPAKTTTPSPPPIPAKATESLSTAGLPSELGVYAHGSEGYVEVLPELVTWRTGGFWKRMATAGLMGGHVNGTVYGGTSRLAMPKDLQLVIVAPEGTSVTEYQLLRLFIKSTRREFRAMTNALVTTRSGADMNLVAFEGEKLKPRTFGVRLSQLPPGEYGLLPPFAAAANLTVAGKIHTFTVR